MPRPSFVEARWWSTSRRVGWRSTGTWWSSPPLELKLVSYFLAHPDEPLTRAHLLDAVWGYRIGGLDTVTVHVRRLREKIEADPESPALINTVWGVGYRFSPDGR